ncbi:hypothetical protein NK942_24515, partial [Salmonella enterica subsp. enterica serovar Typhimurium]|nr:hypothetical protein [Salmonella enterica subsp. enterica serovar Typhimurium]
EDERGNVLTRDQEGALQGFSKIGKRKVILNDLSSAATFISHNYHTPIDVHEFDDESKKIIAEVESAFGLMYQTRHTDGSQVG